MKANFIYTILLTMLIGCFGLTACGSGKDGGQPEQSNLVLVPNTREITADGEQRVTFTVRLNGDDVTTQQGIAVRSDEGENLAIEADKFTFSTTVAGKYTFFAQFGDLESDPVSIAAIPISQNEGAFHRAILAVRFTGTWCVYCYGVDEIMKSLEENEMKDRLVHVALHGNDEMSPYEEQAWQDYFRPPGYPYLYFDMRVAYGPYVIKDPYLEAMQDLVDFCPATTGMKVSSTVENGIAKVSVTIRSTKTDNYKLSVLLLENGIIADQKSTTGTVSDYEHNHVIRGSSMGDIEGEIIGTIDAGEEVTRNYSFDLGGYVAQNCELAIYTMNKEGIKWVVNNACYAAIEGDTGYRHEVR